MGHKNVPIQQRTGPRNRALIEQRIAHTALEVSHAIMRGEDYGEYLLDPLYRLFDADAGAGLITRRPMSPAAASQLTVAAAGVAPVSEEQAIQARPFLGKQPGFLAMARFGATGSVRTSDHIDLPRFWTTESYWRTHGTFGGRYPAGALLFADPSVQIFVGINRHDRDFSDAEMASLCALQRPVAAALAFQAAIDQTVRLLQRTPGLNAGQPGDRIVHRRHSLDSALSLCGEYAPTRREGEVLALAAEGWTNHQIGRRLGITERTVRKHLTAVYDKAGVRGRAGAAAWWQRRQGKE